MITDPATTTAQTSTSPARRGLLYVVSMSLVVGSLVSISIDMLAGLVGGWPWLAAMLGWPVRCCRAPATQRPESEHC